MSLQAVPRIEDVLYKYQPLQVKTYGPPVPQLEQLGKLGYKHIIYTVNLYWKFYINMHSNLRQFEQATNEKIIS